MTWIPIISSEKPDRGVLNGMIVGQKNTCQIEYLNSSRVKKRKMGAIIFLFVFQEESASLSVLKEIILFLYACKINGMVKSVKVL